MLSREAIFLFNNLVLVAMAFVVFFWTFLPLITEALGNKVSVGPPVYNQYIVPLALMLVLLRGSGRDRGLAADDAEDRPAQLRLAARRAGRDDRRPPRRSASRRARRRSSCSRSRRSYRRDGPGVRARRGGPAGDGGREPAAGEASRSSVATAGATAATSSTSAWRCCSSASPRRRRSSTRTTSCSSPARRRRSATTPSRYVRPTSSIGPRAGQPREDRLRRGPRRPKNGKHVTTLRPSKAYFPSQDAGDLGADRPLLRG